MLSALLLAVADCHRRASAEAGSLVASGATPTEAKAATAEVGLGVGHTWCTPTPCALPSVHC